MLQRLSIARILLVAVVFLAGCQPVRPLSPTAEVTATEVAVEAVAQAETAAAEVAAAASSVAGVYKGSLAIAGMELQITVTLQEEDGGYSGTIDIPQQGAAASRCKM